MGSRGVEYVGGESLPADDERAKRERAMLALRWGLGFGVIGALILLALIFVLAMILGVLLQGVSAVFGPHIGDLNYWILARDTAIGPLTCIIVASGLAWLIARSPSTTVPPWVIGLLTGVVGILAGFGALQLTGW